MESLLLHLDEELTNNRVGHSYHTCYDDRDLAYWIQLNSLFCEKLWLPANFLTDSNRIRGVLDVLRLVEPDCALKSEFSPLRIVWRHPHDRFTELVDEMLEQRTDVSKRMDGVTAAEWRETAKLLDEQFFLGGRVERTAYDVTLDYDLSIKLLREDIFNSARNKRYEDNLDLAKRLQECLQCIHEHTSGQDIGGYGRNFFYEVFGHSCTSPTQRQRQRRAEFAPILKPFVSDPFFEHEFLSGVDYASHTIKAAVMGTSLYGPGGDKRIDALMPHEYGRIFRDKNGLPPEVVVDEAPRYMIGADQLIDMDAATLKAIKDTSEYRTYLSYWTKWRNKGQWSVEDAKTDLEHALEDYLRHIATVLKPGHSRTDNILSIALTNKYYTAGASFLVFICSHISGLSVAIDVLSLVGIIAPLAEPLRDRATRRIPLQPRVVSMPGRFQLRFEKKQS
jgi:hypothetical protein